MSIGVKMISMRLLNTLQYMLSQLHFPIQVESFLMNGGNQRSN